MSGKEGKVYPWPPPADHNEDVVCGSSHSLPCRVVFYIVKMFKLPVDLCGVTHPTDIYSPEALAINPIHSMPWMQVYQEGSDKPVCINGSEGIIPYLVNKYRDLIPDSFLSADPLKAALVYQKVAHISNTCYRATMYQYTYPLLGLMSECQYDICKRDFSLDIVEQWAKEQSGDFFEGNEVSLADLFFYSLWLGNNWIADDAKFGKLEWRHKDVIDKYPASKGIIAACEKLDAVKEVNDLTISQGAPSINLVISTGLFGMLNADRPGNARKFNFTAGIHPNSLDAEQRKEVDMPLTL